MFKKYLDKLKKRQQTVIEVGYFDGDENNLLPSIAVWNEYGTENIPSRPFMRNTISENKKKWAANFRIPVIELAELVRDDLSFTIKRGDFKANAPITLYGGWMKNKKSGKPFFVKGKGADKPPLTDTGILAEAIEIKINYSGER